MYNTFEHYKTFRTEMHYETDDETDDFTSPVTGEVKS